MKEIWKHIDGYKYEYQISNLGRVRNWMTGRILKPFKKNHGYLCVGINRMHFRVHKLVAIAFLPNPNNYPYILHRNNIKTDNRANNLKWGLPKDKFFNKEIKRASKPVLHLQTGIFFDSLKEGSECFGLKYYLEGRSIVGKRKVPAKFCFL
jgi:NUMOD4 motif